MSEPTDDDFLAVLDDPQVYALATQDSFSTQPETQIPVPALSPPSLPPYSLCTATQPTFVDPLQSSLPLKNPQLRASSAILRAQQLRRDTITTIEAALAHWKPTLPQHIPHTPSPHSSIIQPDASPSSVQLDAYRSPRHHAGSLYERTDTSVKSAPLESFEPDPYQAEAMAAALAGRSFFLTGSAGTGKSFVLKRLIAELRAEGKAVAVTASTGCAAVGVGGGTIHSLSGVGVGRDPIERLRRKGSTDRTLRARFQRLHVLVIDEVSMIDCFLFDKIEAVIKAARKLRPRERRAEKGGEKRRKVFDDITGAPWKDGPFGGLQVIVCGDFFQLPPVGASDDKYKHTSMKYFAFESQAWRDVIKQTFVLRVVHRQANRNFVGLLNEIRQGVVSGYSREVIGACMVNQRLQRVEADEDGQLVHFTKLYTYRRQVDAENERELRMLKKKGVRFVARDEIYRAELGTLTEAIAQTMLESSSTCNPSVELRTGCRVLCVKNVDTAQGIVNGAAGVLEGWSLPLVNIFKKRRKLEPELKFVELDRYSLRNEDVMQLDHPEIMDATQGSVQSNDSIVMCGHKLSCISPVVRFDRNDRRCMMSAETWEIQGVHGQVIARRTQIPLILGWALSIHRSQGMTLENVETDVGRAFDFGQVYVALSRATSIQKLRLISFNPHKVRTHEKVVKFYEKLEEKAMTKKKIEDEQV